MSIILIIAGRVIASPLVNLFQKKLTNQSVSPELIVAMCYVFFAVLSVPVFLYLKPFHFPKEFWIYIVLLGIFDVLGNMFLVKSLKLTDLSVFGPLNSYKPVFALVFSSILLNEIPSIFGLIGVAVIIFGSYFLGYQPGEGKVYFNKSVLNKGIVYRFLAIALTATAAVFSKKAILLSSPLITFLYWSVIGLPFSIFILYRLKTNLRKGIAQIRNHFRIFVLLFLSFLSLQMFTLLTFRQVFVGYSLALFQLSALVSVLFGFMFFKERNIRYRLLGSAVMIVGAILIAVLG